MNIKFLNSTRQILSSIKKDSRFRNSNYQYQKEKVSHLDKTLIVLIECGREGELNETKEEITVLKQREEKENKLNRKVKVMARNCGCGPPSCDHRHSPNATHKIFNLKSDRTVGSTQKTE